MTQRFFRSVGTHHFGDGPVLLVPLVEDSIDVAVDVIVLGGVRHRRILGLVHLAATCFQGKITLKLQM